MTPPDYCSPLTARCVTDEHDLAAVEIYAKEETAIRLRIHDDGTKPAVVVIPPDDFAEDREGAVMKTRCEATELLLHQVVGQHRRARLRCAIFRLRTIHLGLLCFNKPYACRRIYIDAGVDERGTAKMAFCFP